MRLSVSKGTWKSLEEVKGRGKNEVIIYLKMIKKRSLIERNIQQIQVLWELCLPAMHNLQLVQC